MTGNRVFDGGQRFLSKSTPLFVCVCAVKITKLLQLYSVAHCSFKIKMLDHMNILNE